MRSDYGSVFQYIPLSYSIAGVSRVICNIEFDLYCECHKKTDLDRCCYKTRKDHHCHVLFKSLDRYNVNSFYVPRSWTVFSPRSFIFMVGLFHCGRINKINVTSASRACSKQNIRYKSCCAIGKFIGSEHMEDTISDNNNRRIVNLAILLHNAVWIGKNILIQLQFLKISPLRQKIQTTNMRR